MAIAAMKPGMASLFTELLDRHSLAKHLAAQRVAFGRILAARPKDSKPEPRARRDIPFSSSPGFPLGLFFII